MFTDILWRFLILEMFVLGALFHVTWQYAHPQEQFCTSELVVLVNITERIGSPNANAFLMNIKKVYKGDTSRLNLTNNESVILQLPRTCGIHFIQSYSYTQVIFGENKNGTLYMSSCAWTINWSFATPFQKHALNTFYKDNCDCYEELPSYALALSCHWDHSVLKRRDGNCSWVNTTGLQLCQPLSAPMSSHQHTETKY